MKQVNLKGFDGNIHPYLLEQVDPSEATKIGEEQILKGLNRIKFKHPLAGAKIVEVLPFLCCFKSCTEESNVARDDGKASSSSLGGLKK